MSDSDIDSPKFVTKGRRSHKGLKHPEKRKKKKVVDSESEIESDIVGSSGSETESKYSKGYNHMPDSESENSNHDSDSEKEDTSMIVPAGNFELPGEDEEPKVFVLVGACASGKTYMLKYIHYMYARQKMYKFGVCMTATGFTGDYSFCPERSVMPFDEEFFQGYIENLKKKTEEGVAKHGKGWKLPHNFVIFDDNNGILATSPYMINFISTHRHTRTSVYILSQMLTARGSVSTSMRANTSFAMLWPTNNKSNLKGLYDNYGGAFDKLANFAAALEGCRDREFSCLVLKNSVKHRTVAEQFTTIKAGKFPENFELKF